MTNATMALEIKFALAILFVVCALVLITSGVIAFFRGTGIQKLKDHSFQISNQHFKLDAVVSSAGAIMMMAGCVFGGFGYLSTPTYEASLFTGSVKVTNNELAIPRLGAEAFTASGEKFPVTDYSKTTALSKAWGTADVDSWSMELKTGVAKGLIASYADCLSRNPQSKIVIDYGEDNFLLQKTPKPVAMAWADAFKNAGIDQTRVGIVKPIHESGAQFVPTISITNTENTCPTFDSSKIR